MGYLQISKKRPLSPRKVRKNSGGAAHRHHLEQMPVGGKAGSQVNVGQTCEPGAHRNNVTNYESALTRTLGIHVSVTNGISLIWGLIMFYAPRFCEVDHRLHGRNL